MPFLDECMTEYNKETENMKHTPGPWKIETEYHNDDPESGFHGDAFPAIILDPGNLEIRLSPEHWADAHLITAAPEMLEALKWAIHHIEETHGIKGDELSPIRDAITKAEGKS